MKKCILILVFVLSVSSLFAQRSRKRTSADAKEEKWELARIIKTRVYIKDTAKIGSIASQYDADQSISDYKESTAINYLEPTYFYQFVESMFEVANSKQALVFKNGPERLTASKIRDQYVLCDSVETREVDVMGNEIIQRMLRCDSMSVLTEITCVNFYESWYFNEQTKMIEKEVLAYEPLRYNEKKALYIPIFMIVKDEVANKKLSTYYFGKH